MYIKIIWEINKNLGSILEDKIVMPEIVKKKNSFSIQFLHIHVQISILIICIKYFLEL